MNVSLFSGWKKVIFIWDVINESGRIDSRYTFALPKQVVGLGNKQYSNGQRKGRNDFRDFFGCQKLVPYLPTPLLPRI